MADVTLGLIAHYKMDANALDSSASTNTHNGTLSGATSVNDKDGGVNKALSFDGVNDYLSIPNHADFQLTSGRNMSFSCWVKLPTGFAGGHAAYLQGNNAPYYGWYVHINASRIITVEIKAPSGSPFGTNSTPIPLNVWTNIIVTITRGGSVVFYVDGVADGSFSISSLQANNITNITDYSLSSAHSAALYYKMDLDEVRFYELDLSAGQIADLSTYLNGVSPPAPTFGFSKISGEVEASISKISGVSKANISKVSGV